VEIVGLKEAIKKGPFQVIYADPPWSYREQVQHGGRGAGYTSSASSFYDTMSIEDLCTAPVRELADSSAILFLWSTGPILVDSLRLIDAWGFKYKTVAFVWEKRRCNPGSYTMSSCEYVLCATKGAIPKPRGARNVRQFAQQARTRHSEKPEEFARRIEEMFPTQKKIELFARKTRLGWTCIGNEVEQKEAA
jgi:N6-adenosine-specific RNA methylase IME4